MLGILLDMKWAILTRKAVGVLLILSGSYSVYVFIFVLWDSKERGLDIGFDYLSFIDFWAPIISSVVSLFFITLGVIVAFKGKNWWLVAIGSIFTLLTPIVWQMFPTIREAYVIIPRIIAFLISIMAIILTTFTRKYFKRATSDQRPVKNSAESKII